MCASKSFHHVEGKKEKGTELVWCHGLGGWTLVEMDGMEKDGLTRKIK